MIHKYKAIVLALISMAAATAVASGGITTVGSSDRPNSDQADTLVERALQITAGRINSGLPMMVDEVTRLDSTLPGPGKRWTYLYTFVGEAPFDLKDGAVRNAVWRKIRNGVCTAKDMAAFVDAGVEIVYRYRRQDGTIDGDVVIRPGDCRNHNEQQNMDGEGQ